MHSLFAASFVVFILSTVAPLCQCLPSKKDEEKVVKVYLLLGQSNMVGLGKVPGVNKPGTLEHAVERQQKYGYLTNEKGDWQQQEKVRYTFTKGSGIDEAVVEHNEWMSVEGHKTIGPEFGIMSELISENDDEDILIIKSCIGGRSLGWDLLPPGSKSFEHRDEDGKVWVHPGYRGSPKRWERGTTPRKPRNSWYAGIQYDGDIARAKDVLENIGDHYPGAIGYEMAGIFFWQGDADRRSDALTSQYETNLAQLIRELQKEFGKCNFCMASLGQTQLDDTGNDAKILHAEMKVEKYPEFEGRIATVYTHPLSHGGTSGGHYGGNAETYMDVGQAMGRAMVNLERKKS